MAKLDNKPQPEVLEVYDEAAAVEAAEAAEAAQAALTTPEPAPTPAAVDLEYARFERAADRWVNQFIHNSPVARSTEAYNHVRSVLPELYKLLKQEV